MRISVVIATYNRCALLRDCLEQLAVQHYQPGDEVIVVDNGSTDDTEAVVAAFASAFAVPLRHLRETAPGKTPALITGINASHGEVLALTDDDVLVAQNWLETVRRLFQDPTVSLVGGRVDPRWESQAPPWLQLEHHGRYGRMASPLALQHYGERQPLGARTAVGANLAVRRNVLEAVGGFAPHLGRIRGTLMCGEDHEFCQRVVNANYTAIYDPALVVRHWVPAERVRVRYFLRWFYWSGVTNATLNGTDIAAAPRLLNVPRYIWGQLLRGSLAAATALLGGRRGAAANAAVDAAFAAGYIRKRWAGHGRQEIATRHQQAPQLPAPAQSPAIPIPGTTSGKLDLRNVVSTATPTPTGGDPAAQGSSNISAISGITPAGGLGSACKSYVDEKKVHDTWTRTT